MTEEHIYYKSPLGAIEISGDGLHIHRVSFLNKEGGPSFDENTLDFHPPVSLMLQRCTEQLDDYFSGKLTEFTVSLLQTGTAFQQAVWDLLLQIPYGKTTSYINLSRQTGNVKAIRAVGAANGRNNIAILVPCHRVIGSDGSLVGYAGDCWRKKWLLEHEASCSGRAKQLGMLFP